MFAGEGRFQFAGRNTARRATPHVFDEFREFGDDACVFRRGRTHIYLCLEVARQFFGVTQALDDRIQKACVSNVPQTTESFSIGVVALVGNGTGS